MHVLVCERSPQPLSFSISLQPEPLLQRGDTARSISQVRLFLLYLAWLIYTSHVNSWQHTMRECDTSPRIMSSWTVNVSCQRQTTCHIRLQIVPIVQKDEASGCSLPEFQIQTLSQPDRFILWIGIPCTEYYCAPILQYKHRGTSLYYASYSHRPIC